MRQIIIYIFSILVLFVYGCQSNIQPIHYKNKEIYNEYLKLKNNQFLGQSNQTFTTQLKNSYPVSENCSNAMNSIFDFSNGVNENNMMMMMYSGVGFNEVGNYDGCIGLPSNVSQYCLFQGQEQSLGFYIGVCYPSAKVCSPDDVLGLMTQYSILSILQMTMNFSASQNLHCYNNTYQTVKIEATTGTWIMTAISGFILLNVLIGTFIDYIFVYKLPLYRKKFGGSGNPYSLLNPRSSFGGNSTNLQFLSNENETELEEDENGRFKETTSPFYSGIFNALPDIDIESISIKYLICWSLIKNYNSLVHGSSSKRYFNSLDGIRSLANIWVVLGHTLLFGISGFGYDNMETVVNSFALFSFQVIFSGEFAVDTFFMLSGFLIALSLIGALDKFYSKSRSIFDSIKFWSVYVIHRFIRLSPLYFFLIFFSMWVMPMMGSGPVYYQFQTSVNQDCSEYWWTNVLYINNFYANTICYPVSWYLANDMQFFLLTPFLILIFRKSKLIGWLVVVSLIVSSTIGIIVASYKKNIPPFFDLVGQEEAAESSNSSIYVNGIYDMPWYRIGAYLVGILIAFIYSTPDFSKKARLLYHNRAIRYLFYSISLFITFYISYIPYNFYDGQVSSVMAGGLWNTTQKSFYNGFGHTSFAIGLSIFMLATFYGYGGCVKWFLELPIWKFFSKLTYSSYLVHTLIIMFRLYSMTNFLHYSIPEFSILFIGNLITTYACAFIVHLLIEKPFINLERLIFSSSSSQ